MPPASLILASGSSVRQWILKSAHISFTVIKGTLDERQVEAALRGQSPEHSFVAQGLAQAKAEAVAVMAGIPDTAFVIGADQLLVCDDALFHKPKDLAQLASTLGRLSGRQHFLYTGVAVAQSGRIAWTHMEKIALTMHALSPDEISHYVATHGDHVLDSVGGYHLEAAGPQLFEKIDGDYFAALGLPLLPLLGFLRRQGAIPQ